MDNRLFKVKEYFMLPLDYPMFSVYGSDETFYEAHVVGAQDLKDLCDEFFLYKDEKLFGRDKDFNSDYMKEKLPQCDVCYGIVNDKRVAVLKDGELCLMA